MEVNWCSHHIISEGHAINPMCDRYVHFSHMAEVVFVVTPPRSYSFLS